MSPGVAAVVCAALLSVALTGLSVGSVDMVMGATLLAPASFSVSLAASIGCYAVASRWLL